jgi:hypothetical protein
MKSEEALAASKQRMEALDGILAEYERLVKIAGETGIFRPTPLEPKTSIGGATVDITFSLRAAIYRDFPPPKPKPGDA